MTTSIIMETTVQDIESSRVGARLLIQVIGGDHEIPGNQHFSPSFLGADVV